MLICLIFVPELWVYRLDGNFFLLYKNDITHQRRDNVHQNCQIYGHDTVTREKMPITENTQHDIEVFHFFRFVFNIKGPIASPSRSKLNEK